MRRRRHRLDAVRAAQAAIDPVSEPARVIQQPECAIMDSNVQSRGRRDAEVWYRSDLLSLVSCCTLFSVLS